MGTSLFDSPARPLRDPQSRDERDSYRAISGAAIAAAAVAAVSPVAFFGWSLVAVPLIGVVLAGIAHAHEYATELPEGFVRLSYADLQPAEGEQATRVPDPARAMDGRDVLLKGYIYPGKQQHGLVQFLLVRDQGDCCFGGNPKITDRVLVQLADPAGIDFTPKLTKVAGRFRVQPAGAADLQGGVLYHLDAARVR